MAPTSPPTDAGWTLDGDVLYPSRDYTQVLCSHLAAIGGDDLSLTFTFSPKFGASPTQINVSRLEFAGGPFQALASRDFSEKLTRNVSLSDEDQPAIFTFLRDFLYAKAVRLDGLTYQALLASARAAHRWQLTPLFKGVLMYIATESLLDCPNALLAFVDVAELPGVPTEALVHFWNSVGLFFECFRTRRDVQDQPEKEQDALHDDQNEAAFAHFVNPKVSQRDGNDTKDHGGGEDENGQGRDESVEDDHDIVGTTSQDMQSPVCLDVKSPPEKLQPVEMRLCPGFPSLWSLALSHGMVRIALRSIIVHWEEYAEDLLEVVLLYLEPRIDDDGEVCALMALLDLDSLSYERLLASRQIDLECSTRAMRLFAKTMLSPTVPRDEMRYAWRLCLSDQQDFVKDVFFSPDKCSFDHGAVRDSNEVAEKMLSVAMQGGSRKRSGLSKFDFICQTSVRFTLSVGCDPQDEAGIHLCWRPGVVFLYEEDEKLQVDLEVLDNGCQCPNISHASYKGQGGCLVREQAKQIVDENGLLSLRINPEQLALYLAVHSEDCFVTISMVVRVIKNKDAW